MSAAPPIFTIDAVREAHLDAWGALALSDGHQVSLQVSLTLHIRTPSHRCGQALGSPCPRGGAVPQDRRWLARHERRARSGPKLSEALPGAVASAQLAMQVARATLVPLPHLSPGHPGGRPPGSRHRAAPALRCSFPGRLR